jgi:hypothetical protein
MKTKHVITIGILGLVTLCAGCTGPSQFEMPGPSRVEMDYGTSFKLSKFNQILNPEAEKNLDPVTGMDGQAAKATLDKYRKDFEKPPAPPVYTLSFGTNGR